MKIKLFCNYCGKRYWYNVVKKRLIFTGVGRPKEQRNVYCSNKCWLKLKNFLSYHRLRRNGYWKKYYKKVIKINPKLMEKRRKVALKYSKTK